MQKYYLTHKNSVNEARSRLIKTSYLRRKADIARHSLSKIF